MATNQLSSPDKESLEKLPWQLKYQGEFFLRNARSLGWNLTEEPIMDVGCGARCSELFLNLFPEVHKVIGLDIDINVVHPQRALNLPNMDFHLRNIMFKDSILEWQSEIKYLVSFFCLEHLSNSKAALENIHFMMKPGGEAIMLTSDGNIHYLCAQTMLRKLKWERFKSLLELFPEHICGNRDVTFYQNQLSRLGFCIKLCSTDARHYPFLSLDAFKTSPFAMERVVTNHLPEELKDDFRHEYISELASMCKLNDVWRYPMGVAQIVIKKI